MLIYFAGNITEQRERENIIHYYYDGYFLTIIMEIKKNLMRSSSLK
jgi:hypothetical protein